MMLFHSLKQSVLNGKVAQESIANRIAEIDWIAVRSMLNQRGFAILPPILTEPECQSLIALYPNRDRFRSRVDMARLRFGIGEYKYFANPLPAIVSELRETLYPRVAPIANEWSAAIRLADRFPPTLAEFLARCHREGQTKPTPLMLRYETGGYNCLHQDLYGEMVFPIQFTFMLSRADNDFEGGQFLLIEQRLRAQSRGDAIALEQGGAILFPTRYRPIQGTRGFYRVGVRHGVSRIERGLRFTLGIIFHDAK
jgi:hypothetical protein